jgi:hypothetical protein
MPEKLKRELRAKAKAKGLSRERTEAYVYGTLNKIEEGKKKHHSAEVGSFIEKREKL